MTGDFSILPQCAEIDAGFPGQVTGVTDMQREGKSMPGQNKIVCPGIRPVQQGRCGIFFDEPVQYLPLICVRSLHPAKIAMIGLQYC